MRNQIPKLKVLRCAIYTRKSSEEGLEQDFNSLHAQRESCEAYVKSQKHEGWTTLAAVYDDGGYSGGSMERPALKRLLADIQSKSIDVVVVYKVDRLTRSLTDFAKIVEVFDAAGVSFVSVTQQFNTTTSMGRLTLNVLLSFAQFEREVTGERIRDKIAASKQKGMWMGGWVPLGYDRRDRTLTINETEAKTVRTIFELFLTLKNVREVQAELARLKLTTKPYAVQRGRATGNLPFARGHLYKILSNPLYVGEIEHKGMRHPGQHPALITPSTWEAVQAQLAANSHANRSRSNAKSTSLLAGLIFDEAGHRLVSSHATKNGKRYRYYVSSDGLGRAATKLSKLRVPAAIIDQLVLTGLQDFLKDKSRISSFLRQTRHRTAQLDSGLEIARQLADSVASATDVQPRLSIADLVRRVTVGVANLKIGVDSVQLHARLSGAGAKSALTRTGDLVSFEVPFVANDRAETTKLLIEKQGQLPPDAVAVKAIARAWVWLEQLTQGKAQSMAEIAALENITDNYVSNLIHLAWLSPLQVNRVLNGEPTATELVRKALYSRSMSTLWNGQL